ncbi:type III-A CRISPR-associated protein Cas10/Csm1 [Accumulibacter sp.]|uniref:type III-A CRISPR-associated protein Cas10/Csm1 n=1 Tax=Accumulibacter sp. TaxID=2053492 RepID=UPI0025D23AC6|nr:type III-A CRISPR-associated protein Cas10/Csm1 [Accumulibacter sp.]MCM8611166.1 type III-A CRISPR-associated protein Cas10/Csm1 [Accumulibacter sp.]MCM8636280.1 type III-A CRISPR-associated protein Cas10/Csm1 [Accumulibacter sp.]MCM8638491.1 type III-A CRISPR-associated protein Cas10/Csm1 [Accumulibacter sp.]
MTLLEQSARIALAALLHDVGKLAERAGIEHHGRLDAHRTLYCPWQQETGNPRHGYHSHVHAAFTALAWDELEATGHFPDLRRDAPPFATAADGHATDSAVNAASAHHRPESFLQWIVATADRVASGFERDEFERQYNRNRERDNHYRARLLTLFEQIGRGRVAEGELDSRYPLQPLAPASIFPQPASACTPRDDASARSEYLALWQALLAGLRLIPRAHLASLPLWLDHFDSLWLTTTHAIPSATAFGVKPEVSLYDHSKATAALATALWRWHRDEDRCDPRTLREGWSDEKFLLVQGDVFGIQDFIFAAGGATQKHAHKLLRGRSFQVSLFAECAALKILDALELPPTSQIINAAGKFLIVAANTPGTHAALARCRQQLDDWCLRHTCAEIGVGLVSTPASCNDFAAGRFGALTRRLFAALDTAKHQRFDLCAENTSCAFDGFLDRFDNTLGVCAINGRHPADREASARRGYSLSRLADDQIRIGEELTRHARLLVARDAGTLPVLGLDYFGYHLAIVPGAEESGSYGELARNGSVLRIWDFDAPEADGTIWRGHARRFLNSYVPRFDAGDLRTPDRYGRWQGEAEAPAIAAVKTLNLIACEDRQQDGGGGWQGEIALMVLKGDIDNLGSLFQQGLERPTFAKMASLSRQVNGFFSLWLPWFCEHGLDGRQVARYRNTYTVFAGGDDFFLIGPWESTLALATELRGKFSAYVGNPAISFSAGLCMAHPKTPVRQLARSAEAALAAAKEHPGKNAATLWQHTVGWADWQSLMGPRRRALEALMERTGNHGAAFSGGLTYTLLQLSDRAGSRHPEDAIWRSQLHYQLARFFRDRVRGDEAARACRERLLLDAIGEIGSALGSHGGAYRLPLSVLLYRQRQ